MELKQTFGWSQLEGFSPAAAQCRSAPRRMLRKLSMTPVIGEYKKKAPPDESGAFGFVTDLRTCKSNRTAYG